MREKGDSMRGSPCLKNIPSDASAMLMTVPQHSPLACTRDKNAGQEPGSGDGEESEGGSNTQHKRVHAIELLTQQSTECFVKVVKLFDASGCVLFLVAVHGIACLHRGLGVSLLRQKQG